MLAVLDRAEAARRLERESLRLRHEITELESLGEGFVLEGDHLEAMKSFRQALQLSMRNRLIRQQLGVIDPSTLWKETPVDGRQGLAARLAAMLLQFEFSVEIESLYANSAASDNQPDARSSEFIRDAIHEALSETDFTLRMDPGPVGLTLWGRLNITRDTYPSAPGGEDLQVCRVHLGLKILDNQTQRIIGQVNMPANSNAKDQRRAEQRAMALLSERITQELAQELYKAVSMESP